MKEKLQRLIVNDIPLTSSGIHTFLNPFSYYLIRKNGQLLENFNSLGIDGISMVWMLQMLGHSDVKRSSFDFTSQAPLFFRYCETNNKSICLVGSENAVIVKAVEIIQASYPQLKIKMFRNGFFKNDLEMDQFQQEIIANNIDAVVCGMGTPYQEKFLLKLKEKGWDGVGATCGGFFHQIIDKGVDYYASWINTLHLRWAYRIYKEPKLLKRYFKFYPIGLFCIARDFLVL